MVILGLNVIWMSYESQSEFYVWAWDNLYHLDDVLALH